MRRCAARRTDLGRAAGHDPSRSASPRRTRSGATRTEYSINDTHSRTSLTAIKLQRPDGTGGWLRHFMHYYRLPEITTMMEGARRFPVAIREERGGRVTDTFDEHESEGMVIIATRA